MTGNTLKELVVRKAQSTITFVGVMELLASIHNFFTHINRE
jgi:hypothetical protein